MAIVAISIAPTGAGAEGEGTSVGRYVAEALRVLEAQEAVRFELGSMFTTLEGDLDAIFSLIRQMQEAIFAMGASRVGTVIKIDDRRDREVTMQDKIDAVKTALRGS